jgi:hypothetical protein
MPRCKPLRRHAGSALPVNLALWGEGLWFVEKGSAAKRHLFFFENVAVSEVIC